MKSVKYSAHLPTLFASTAALQQAFAEGLTRMLERNDGLGGYILALANAAQDATLWQLLESRLEERHYHLAALVTAALHRQGTPYHLIYTSGRLYLLPRRPQGSYPQAPWSMGHAWFEMAGGVVLCNRADYEGLVAEAIAAELQRVGQV